MELLRGIFDAMIEAQSIAINATRECIMQELRDKLHTAEIAEDESFSEWIYEPEVAAQ